MKWRVSLCFFVIVLFFAPLRSGLIFAQGRDTIEATILMQFFPYDLAFDPINNKVYCAEYSDKVAVIDGVTNVILTRVVTNKYPRALVYDSVDDQIYCANDDSNMVSVIDCRRDSLLAVVRVGRYPVSLAHNPVDRKIYVGTWKDSSITILDSQQDTVIKVLRIDGGTFYFAHNTLNDKMYAATLDGSLIYVLSGSRDSVIATMPSYTVRDILWNPLSDKVYWTNHLLGTVSIADGAGDTLLAQVRVGDRPVGLAFDPYRNRIYCANYGGGTNDSTVMVIDGVTDQVLDTVVVGVGPRRMVFNPDNRRLYTYHPASSPGTVSIVDTRTNVLSQVLTVGMTPGDLCYNSVSHKVYCANGGDNTVTVIRCAPLGVNAIEDIQNFRLTLTVDPNPFQSKLKVTLSAFQKEGADIKVFDITGRIIKNFPQTIIQPGNNTLYWDGKDNRGTKAPKGVYFISIKIGRGVMARKIIKN